jgi:hypothetical protein
MLQLNRKLWVRSSRIRKNSETAEFLQIQLQAALPSSQCSILSTKYRV